MKLSQGYGSEFIVLNAQTKEVVSDVLLLYPLQNKEEFEIMRQYVIQHNDTALAQALKRYEEVWNAIEEAKK